MPAYDHELLTILDNLEKSYIPTDPNYKFLHVFYNVVNTPFDRPPNFPPHLWNQAILPDRTLMPVILNKEQVFDRKKVQDELATKLNDAHAGLQRRIESLQVKRAETKHKLIKICKKYREIARQYAVGQPVEEVYKLQVEIPTRDSYLIKERHDEIIAYLVRIKERLKNIEKQIEDAIYDVDKQLVGVYKLNRE